LDDLKIGFIGSVAYFFQDVLEIVASERKVTILKVEKNPMSGLISYHS
jgi:hypothetical protein